MSEIEDVSVGHWTYHIRHRGVVGASRIAFVLAQRLHQVVFALAGQARNILCPGKIRVMAEIAPVLLDQRARPVEPGGVRRFGGSRFEINSAVLRTSSSLRPFVISFGDALGAVSDAVDRTRIVVRDQGRLW